jgi:PPK2 family polyphosphate:nucleotide phosphotransferase
MPLTVSLKVQTPTMTKQIRDLLRVPPGRLTAPGLAAVDPRSTPGAPKGGKQAAVAKAAEDGIVLADLQSRLFAEGKGAEGVPGGRRRVLLVLQGMDTSGKDGTVRHVVGEVNPAGVHTAAFGPPSAAELRHDFLWRIRRELPAAGIMGVFNRSHYEDVLVVRVHSLVPAAQWRARYEMINDFEAELTEAGTTIVKVMLHLSPEEQGARLVERLDDPAKRWKFREGDIAERRHWKAYQTAYAEALWRTSTDIAPWYVVPADRKWYRNFAIGRILRETLQDLDPQPPQPAFDMAAVRASLVAGL